MEKHNRFMAELQEVLMRYHVVLIGGKEGEDVEEAALATFAVFTDDHVDDPEGYQGHAVYDSDGAFMDYDPPDWEEIPVEDVGLSYMHCGLCVAEIKEGKMPPFTSPKKYARQQVSYTRQGFQVWCTRHEVNILHMDFGGRKVRANMDYAKTPMEKLARAHEGEE